MILRPLVDAYMAAAMCLHEMIGKELTESDFLQKVLAKIKTQLESGYCSYGKNSSVFISTWLGISKSWKI